MNARSIGSAIAPTWLANMTLISLFVSIFGLALFSSVMLGTQNVDVFSIITASQGLPNLFDRLGVLTRMFERCTSWIPSVFNSIPSIPVVEFFTFVINALLKIAELISYLVGLIPCLLFAVVLLPIWLAVDTINILDKENLAYEENALEEIMEECRKEDFELRLRATSRIFGDFTGANVGKRLAIVLDKKVYTIITMTMYSASNLSLFFKSENFFAVYKACFGCHSAIPNSSSIMSVAFA